MAENTNASVPSQDDDVSDDGGKPMNELGVGDTDDTTGEKIFYLVYSTEDFAVTIDTKLSLNWQTVDGFDGFPSDFGKVLSQVELADELVDSIFRDFQTRVAFKKMLGSVIARLLDDKNSKYACEKLAIVEGRIKALGNERIRMHYILSSLFTVGVIGIGFLVVRIFKIDQSMTWDNLMILWSMMLGGVGAFITTFARFQNYSGNLEAGLTIHWLDGFLRVFYGLVAGLIVYYAVKANVLVGFGNDSKSSQPWLFYFLAVVAGASEVLVPNLIRQTEGKVSVEEVHKKVKDLEQKVNAGSGGNGRTQVEERTAVKIEGTTSEKTAVKIEAATPEKTGEKTPDNNVGGGGMVH